MSEMRGRQTEREEIMYSISQTPRSQNHKNKK